ncbi:MAG TPA: hypothetical protein VGP72_03450 [Planctomycetota bacterium]|jgi:hypothetical protein
MHIFLEGAAKWILVLHALSAVVLIGSLAHLAWRALRGTLAARGLQNQWVLWSYIVTFVSGVLIYPTYRYYVRALYFERAEGLKPANFFFEVKEHLSALGLILLLAYWLISRIADEKEVVRFRRVSAVSLFVIVLYGYVASLVLNNLKGI